MAFLPSYRAELHPIGGGHRKWMEAGDPPVHRDRTGPLAAPWGEADVGSHAEYGDGRVASPTRTRQLTSQARHTRGIFRRV